MGHELGGLAALSLAAGDSRVKSVCVIDPLLAPYSKEIRQGKLRIMDPAQALCVIESEAFCTELDSFVSDGGKNQRNDLSKRLASSANETK